MKTFLERQRNRIAKMNQPSEITIHPVLGEMYHGELAKAHCEYFEAKHAYFEANRDGSRTVENYHKRQQLADAARNAEAAFAERYIA